MEASEAFTASYHDNYIGQSDALATAFWARFAMREVGSHDPEPRPILRQSALASRSCGAKGVPTIALGHPTATSRVTAGVVPYRMSLFTDECDGLCKSIFTLDCAGRIRSPGSLALTLLGLSLPVIVAYEVPSVPHRILR